MTRPKVELCNKRDAGSDVVDCKIHGFRNFGHHMASLKHKRDAPQNSQKLKEQIEAFGKSLPEPLTIEALMSSHSGLFRALGAAMKREQEENHCPTEEIIDERIQVELGEDEGWEKTHRNLISEFAKEWLEKRERVANALFDYYASIYNNVKNNYVKEPRDELLVPSPEPNVVESVFRIASIHLYHQKVVGLDIRCAWDEEIAIGVAFKENGGISVDHSVGFDGWERPRD